MPSGKWRPAWLGLNVLIWRLFHNKRVKYLFSEYWFSVLATKFPNWFIVSIWPRRSLGSHTATPVSVLSSSAGLSRQPIVWLMSMRYYFLKTIYPSRMAYLYNSSHENILSVFLCLSPWILNAFRCCRWKHFHCNFIESSAQDFPDDESTSAQLIVCYRRQQAIIWSNVYKELWIN